MKKNRMMRLASGLLVAVLATTSVISGTYAKYTTQDSAKDEARVAKWGVELQVVGDLYGESYDDNIVVNAADTGTNITVQMKDYATAEDNLVAPGTQTNTGFSFKLNGTPEVDGKIKTTIAYENIYLTKGAYGVMVEIPDGVVTEENFGQIGTVYTVSSGTYSVANAYAPSTKYYTLEDNMNIAEDYYPVEYKMTGALANYNTGYDTELKVDTLKGVVSALTANLGAVQGTPVVEDGKTTTTWLAEFDTNTNLTTMYKIGGQNISWKWDFCQQSECEDGDAACGFCKADTVLGNLKAGLAVVKATDPENLSTTTYKAPEAASGIEVKDYNLETSFSIDITVTQVD